MQLVFNVMSEQVRDCVKQINLDSWLIGKNLVLQRTTSAEKYLWKDESNGSCYVLSTPPATPEAHPLSPNGHVQLVRSLGRASAVWGFGDAFLKVQLSALDAKTTKEHVTLNWLAQQNLSFNTPKVLYHTQESDRTFLFISRVPGETLNQAWRTMSNNDKEYYFNRVADVCKELSSLTSSAIKSVNGCYLSDTWLDVRDRDDFSPETLRANCEKMGMDCLIFVFSHNDLAPTNIIVNSGQGRGLGMVDWEMAGCVPPAWIRTKFAVSWGLNFEWRDVQAEEPSLTEWRGRVQQQLSVSGFENVKQAWRAWFDSKD